MHCKEKGYRGSEKNYSKDGQYTEYCVYLLPEQELRKDTEGNIAFDRLFTLYELVSKVNE